MAHTQEDQQQQAVGDVAGVESEPAQEQQQDEIIAVVDGDGVGDAAEPAGQAEEEEQQAGLPPGLEDHVPGLEPDAAMDTKVGVAQVSAALAVGIAGTRHSSWRRKRLARRWARLGSFPSCRVLESLSLEGLRAPGHPLP